MAQRKGDKKEMFQALHPDPQKKGMRVTKATYEIYRDIMLQVIPDDEEGILFMELSAAIEPHVPAEVLSNSSVGWWTTTVKLDLEARQLIERVPGRGRQRVRKRSDDR